MTFCLLDRLGEFTEKDLLSFYPKLSLQRRKKVDSLRFLPDKIASASAYLLLRYSLKKEYGYSDAPKFGFLAEKKPFLIDREDVFFSLSHDRSGVGVALSEKPVGADVQTLFKYENILAETILSEKERSVFDLLHIDDALITRLWTMKESLGKKRGDGVAPFLTSTDFSNVGGEGVYFYGEDVFTVGNKNNLFYCVCSSFKEETKLLSPKEFSEEVALLSDVYI